VVDRIGTLQLQGLTCKTNIVEFWTTKNNPVLSLIVLNR